MVGLFGKLSKKAQSTFEYTIIVTLVAAAIIIIGPYVIRSWNAYLKSTEASLLDSLQDPLQEADSGLFELPSCECGDWYETTCGDSFEEEQCGKFEKGMRRNCTGTARVCEEQGYDTFRCNPRPLPPCCTEWMPGLCGVNAEHVSCEDGYREYMRECGPGLNPKHEGWKPEYGDSGNSSRWEYKCERDTECDFHCAMVGNWPQVGTYKLCKDSGYDPDDESRLPDNTNYTFVEDDGCTSDTKCEIECQDPALVRGNGCGCPTGYAYQGECSDGYCEQRMCSEGYCEQ